MPRKPYPPFALQISPPGNAPASAPAVKATSRPLVTQWRVAAAILAVFLTLAGVGIASSLTRAPAAAAPAGKPAAPARVAPPAECR